MMKAERTSEGKMLEFANFARVHATGIQNLVTMIEGWSKQRYLTLKDIEIALSGSDGSKAQVRGRGRRR
jgi:hypothetical protein